MGDATQEQGARDITLGVDDQVEAALEDRVVGAQRLPGLDRNPQIGDEFVDAAADQRRQHVLQVE